MRHLVLSRRVGERLFLHVEKDADPVKILEQLQREGIMIDVREIRGGKVKLSVEAPSDISIVRDELGEWDVRETRGYRRPPKSTSTSSSSSG
ncbi:carbon storage regulator [Pseudomonas sp. GD04158]|uniref:carbon storage regulator n=1 Tax=Pseudomonas sp. GD04158 TaxID=2975439 RepID=UPI00244D542E|nr:carbon storage regulator [Pseudomonas sp. GD04158]MDH0098241.1 carbon storage regulator [Pseudomonas sp. GD04158]